MTNGNGAIDVSYPPVFMNSWKSNFPIVIQSMKLHPLLMGFLLVASIVNAMVPLAGFLCSVGVMIAMVFIEYTIIRAVWSNITDGAPNYIVTDSDVQWRMVVAQLIVNVLTFVMALLFILPGGWYMVKSCLALMAVCIENKAPQEAITRSHILTQGHFGRTLVICFAAPFAITLGIALVAFIILLIVLVPTNMISKQLGSIVIIPLQAAITVGLYVLMLSIKPPLVHLYAYLSHARKQTTSDAYDPVQRV